MPALAHTHSRPLMLTDDWRVMSLDGPLGTERLTVRQIAEAEGFVFCRHGQRDPIALKLTEWQALPLAREGGFDI